jgi:NADH-quinone oxidoreductase subunit G
VIASDLEEEVPMWRLRLKHAQDKGAYLVVANARMTKMEQFATDTWAESNRNVEGAAIRYAHGDAAKVMATLKKENKEVADRLAQAKNLVIVAGSEGLTLDGHRALVQAAANFLIETNHAGKMDSGLLVPFAGANGMGLYYNGYTPEYTQDISMNPPKALILLDADVLGDDPFAGEWLSQVETIVHLTMFPDATSKVATFSLPIQSFAERDGTFTNGERRVQRFYTAQGPIGDALPAWKALTELRQVLGQSRAKLSAAAVMLELSKSNPAFEGMRYKELSRTERQFPDVGGTDKYYGGTAYQNKGGVGLQIPLMGEAKKADVKLPDGIKASGKELMLVPSTRLYDRSNAFIPSVLVHGRIPAPYALLNPADALKLGIGDDEMIEISFGKSSVVVRAVVTDDVSAGAVVLPRKLSEEASPISPTSAVIAKAAVAVH